MFNLRKTFDSEKEFGIQRLNIRNAANGERVFIGEKADQANKLADRIRTDLKGFGDRVRILRPDWANNQLMNIVITNTNDTISENRELRNR